MKKKTVPKKSKLKNQIQKIKKNLDKALKDSQNNIFNSSPPPPPIPKKPDELKDIKILLNFLNQSYEKMAKYVEGERNRNLSMQTYIGEAVTYELLHQSYGIPEYTLEEKLKRFLSCILQAIDNYYKAKEKQPPFNSEIIDNLWNSQDPHHLPEIIPNSSTTKIRESYLSPERLQSWSGLVVTSMPTIKYPKSK
jgi:hypothetical protein